MRLHGLAAEEGTPAGDVWVIKTQCLCDHLFTAKAGTVRKARKMIRRRYRDHRGTAMAAGPGGPE